MNVLKHLLGQIREAHDDLRGYRPGSIDWRKRSRANATGMAPWLVSVAPGVKCRVEEVLNSSVALRSMWLTIRQRVNLPHSQVEAFDRQLILDDVLRESVTGDVVSNIVTNYLLGNHPASLLKSNGRSDYPDIYDARRDYASLPAFARKKTGDNDDTYGAALKGKDKRPVRVPDGLEIKTCRTRIAVDCHHPHAGLHLVLVFTEAKRVFTVKDVALAFLQSSDYRECKRNTTATTVKYSFNGDRFVSLLAHEAD